MIKLYWWFFSLVIANIISLLFVAVTDGEESNTRGIMALVALVSQIAMWVLGVIIFAFYIH